MKEPEENHHFFIVNFLYNPHKNNQSQTKKKGKFDYFLLFSLGKCP